MLFAHLERVLKLDRLRCEVEAARTMSSCWQPLLAKKNMRRLAIRAVAAMNQSNMAFA